MNLRTRVLVTSGAVIAAAAPVLAQDPQNGSGGATQPQAGAPRAAVEGEIVVTAQKREQRLIDVPQSVSVVSSDLLQQTHSQRLDDFFNRVPSASINEAQAGRARIILRGINTGGFGATVATYVDETPFGSATALANGGTLTPDVDPSEIDRVEVLRGPQGTLYGANSLGGLIKYVTIAPSTDAVHASAEGGVESIDHGGTGWSGRAALNLPVSGTLAVRGSGFYRKDAGWIDDPNHGRNVNDDREYGGKFSALWKPTSALTLRGTALLQNIDSNGFNTFDADPVTLAPTIGRYDHDHIVSTPNNVRYRVYNGTGTYDFGPVTLLSSTSWGNLRQKEVQDVSSILAVQLGLPLGTVIPGSIPETVNQKRFTQEVRLSSATHGFLDWTLGGFYTHERNGIFQSLNENQPNGNPLPGGVLETVVFPSSYREIAGFANATLHFSSRFDLTLGGRYSHNKQRSDEQAFIGGVLAADFPGRSSDNVFTYSVAPSFKPNEDTTIYARVARGYRPGGPNVLPPATPPGVPRSFSPDTTTNYEVGVKSELLDRKLSLELTGFYIDWRKIQLASTVEGFGLNVNGGKARSKGIELSAVLTPTKGLTFSANGAYIDAYLRQDVPALGASSGDHLPYTAHFAGTLAADYQRPLTDRINGTAGVSWRYTGHRPSAFASPTDLALGLPHGPYRLGAFSQVDAHAGVTFGAFRLDAFVRNLTNSRGVLDVDAFGSSSNPGAIAVAIVRPRSVGATFGFSY